MTRPDAWIKQNANTSRGFLDFKRKMSQAREKVKIDLDNIEELFGLVGVSRGGARTRKALRRGKAQCT